MSSTHAQAQHFNLGSTIQNPSQHQNHTDCPMWFNYSSATNDCQCFSWPLRCDGKSASVDSGQILTYDSHKGLISTITIQHDYLGGYNKTKTGCILLTSCTNVCHFCQDTWNDMIVLYISLEFIPVTVFYLLVLIFQIQLTSAPMTCFIMYSQLIVLAYYEECASQSTPTSLFSQINSLTVKELLEWGQRSFLPYMECLILTSFTMFSILH